MLPKTLKKASTSSVAPAKSKEELDERNSYSDFLQYTDKKNGTIDDGESNPERIVDEATLERLRSRILFSLFFGKFAEMMTVLTVIAYSMDRWPVFQVIQNHNIMTIQVYIIIVLLAMYDVSRFPCYKRCTTWGAWLALRAFHVLYLTFTYYMFGAYFPTIFEPYLSWHFILMSPAIAAATYSVLSLAVITRMARPTGLDLWVYGAAMPVFVFTGSQMAYSYGDGAKYYGLDLDFNAFMVTTLAGIFTSVLFTYESIFIYQKLVTSSQVDELAKTYAVPDSSCQTTARSEAESNASLENQKC